MICEAASCQTVTLRNRLKIQIATGLEVGRKPLFHGIAWGRRRPRMPSHPALARKTRYAIYTRKSATEGLEREYNTLESQRDVCSAYVRTKRHQGWIEIAERCDVTFVSVTQSFDTLDSTGQLLLNVLLTFAQFEREMLIDRIRDKIAAMKRAGRWTSGPPPLGYDVVEGKLIVNEIEATVVRDIFSRFL